MQGPLLFLAVVVVAVLERPGILRCWGWDLDFVQVRCLCSIVIGTVGELCVLLLLDYRQWMGQQDLVGGSMGVVIVVHTLVALAILQN